MTSLPAPPVMIPIRAGFSGPPAITVALLLFARAATREEKPRVSDIFAMIAAERRELARRGLAGALATPGGRPAGASRAEVVERRATYPALTEARYRRVPARTVQSDAEAGRRPELRGGDRDAVHPARHRLPVHHRELDDEVGREGGDRERDPAVY